MRYVVISTVMLCAVATVSPRAQEPAAAKQVFERKMTLDAKMQTMRVAVDSRVTRNAPYSAEAVTESTQLLADGNRIVTKSATRIFRDSEGRTRREQLNAAGSDAVNVNISDPVAGTSYTLDPGSHTAFSGGQIFVAMTGTPGNVMFRTSDGGSGGAGIVTTDTLSITHTPDEGVMVAGREHKEMAEAATLAKLSDEVRLRSAGPDGPPPLVAIGAFPARIAEASGKTTREELGQQMIEGVMAAGSRTITEIPAGAIGNEQPIKIVSEQWFSPELQVLVMTKHSDPRVGETVYRLTGIVRAEPAHLLFDVPPDYTVHESAIRREER